jgi:tripartite ATP-independent transporter DctM subunit
MNAGKMTDRIIAFLRGVFGPIRGGLAHINVVASMIFAGVSGAAVADASSVGTIMIKAMEDEGYEPDYSAAVSGASATVGPIIPPSVPMVVAGALAELSVVRLFVGGIIPGLLMGIFMMGVVIIVAHRRNHPKFPRMSMGDVLKRLINSGADLILPIAIIGGIVFGVFTPTEGAGIAVLAALFIGILLHHDLTIPLIIKCAKNTLVVTAEVLLIASVAIAFGWVLTYEHVPQTLISFIAGISVSRHIVLFIIILSLLLLGCMIAGMATLLIAVPILIPLAPLLGIDPYHLTLIIVLATMLGTLTPPVGVTLFIVASVGNRPIGAVVKEMLPFLGANVLVLLLLAYIPDLALLLPRLIYG